MSVSPDRDASDEYHELLESGEPNLTDSDALEIVASETSSTMDGGGWEDSYKRLQSKIVEHSGYALESIDAAVFKSYYQGLRPVRALFASSLLTESQLRDMLAAASGLVLLNLDDFEESAFNLLSNDQMERLRSIPYKWDGDILLIARTIQPDPATLGELEDILGGIPFQISICRTEQWSSSLVWLRSTRSSNETETTTNLANRNQIGPYDRYQEMVSTSSGQEIDRRIDTAVESLLARAAAEEASDIHISTVDGDRGEMYTEIKLRVQGRLMLHDKLTKDDGARIISRFRAAGGMSFDRTTSHDARYDISLDPDNERRYDLRLVAMPTRGDGDMMVIRLLPQQVSKSNDLDLQALYPETESDIAKRVTDCIARPDGMFLLTGRTGDGKSTTLAALMRHLARPEVKAVTAEEPVEYVIQGAEQVEITPQNTWNKVLPAFLRCDPDVIMVGEVRDEATARLAVQAALTGHVVLTTLHVTSAWAAPLRFLNIIGEKETAGLSEALNGVLAQRLLRVLCDRCAVGDIADKKPRGCTSCKNGWRGRTAVGELLVITPEVEIQIVGGANASGLVQPPALPMAIREASNSPTLIDHAAMLVNLGRTSREEAERVVGRLPELDSDGLFKTRMSERVKS